MAITHYWTDGHIRYEFQVDLLGTAYRQRSGVYIICQARMDGYYNALYVGETSDFNNRIGAGFALHHRRDCVTRRGATHIHTLHVPGPALNRERIELALRHRLNPPCNLE